MRYLYASFKGYVGFYNGMGLEKLEIDFTKCKHNIILICGINGCGKSTLMNSLTVFPDPSSAFVPNIDGEKKLVLFSEGDTYEICITSPCDNKGGRKQTKAFILKNGLQLNENGNVTSYKEIIFSEFELDSNYISLTKLSGDDRGLGDKTPAERKKFTANIIDNLEVYNNIYKTLNKKSLIFKSHLNTLHTKIQNIGDKDNLELVLNSLREQEKELNSRLMEFNNQIVTIKAKTDISEKEAEEYNNLLSTRDDLINRINSINSDIDILRNKTKIKRENISEEYDKSKELSSFYNIKIEELSKQWMDKSNQIMSNSGTISNLEVELSMSDSNLNNDIEKLFEESIKKIENLEKEISFLYKEKIDDSSIDELEKIIAFCFKFTEFLYKFYDGLDSLSSLEWIVYKYDANIINKLNEEISVYKTNIESINNKIIELESYLKFLDILNDRPKNCKIDSCPFISDSLDIKKKFNNKTNIESLLNEQKSMKLEYSKKIIENEKMIENYHLWISKRMFLDTIIDDYLNISNLFAKYKVKNMENIDILYKKLSLMSEFNEQKNPSLYIDLLNLLKQLKYERDLNYSLKVDYEAYREKIKLINSTRSILDKLNKEQEKLSKEVSSLKEELDKFKELNNTLKNNIVSINSYYNLNNSLKELETELNNINSKINLFNEKSSKVIEASNVIKELNDKISQINNEIKPVNNDINRISGQLTLLESYYIEYNEYKEKFNMIETIKKYCSPTGGGIQVLFMQLYMSKTLELSNQILSLLFNGEYKLLDFVINENEFRIPFIGSGLPVDDITSGSTSQICMMGTTINLVLMHQASTKFNIARLDEVDGGLDHLNKAGFIEFIHKIKQILGIEQFFAISHSLEADTSSVDIIKLKSYSDYDNSILGNVIYDYNNQL